jgi:hypothetical protein
MNTPTIPREELKEKLEGWITESARAAEGKAAWGSVYFEALGDHLRACLTELERGEADTKILDAIDNHMMHLSHTRATCSVMMCGTTIHGQFENLDRVNGGGSFRKVKGRNIREAVLSAITTNQQEAE